MLERLLKLRPGRDVAGCALFIDGRRLSRHQPEWPMSVDGVTCCTRHLVLRMAALNATGVRRLVQMALKTQAVCRRWRQLPRVPDFFRGTGFRMPAARP